MSNKIGIGIVGLVAVIALVVSLASLSGSSPANMAGEVRNLGATGVGIYQALVHHFGTGVRVGDGDASLVKEVIHTTCTLSTTELPLEASSTDRFYCPVAGVKSGDKVEVSLPNLRTYTFDTGVGGQTGLPFRVGYSIASSTADGYIEVGLTNTNASNATSTFPLATTTAEVTVTRYSN